MPLRSRCTSPWRAADLQLPEPSVDVLYRVVRTHLVEFLEALNAETDGSGIPGFVVSEFRKFRRFSEFSLMAWRASDAWTARSSAWSRFGTS